MSYKGSNHQAEEKVMLAREEKDHMYEPKPNKKAIRILTVAAYVLCVSLAAIILSLYYVFFWDPSTKPVTVKPATGCGHFLQNSEQVSESEFRKITGIEKVGDLGRAVNPSIGPSIPTAVINKDRIFDVKEIQMEVPVVANLVFSGIGGGISTLVPPENVDRSDQQDQGGDDTEEYQGDEMDEFEMDESSGQGAVYKSHAEAVNKTVGEGNGNDI